MAEASILEESLVQLQVEGLDELSQPAREYLLRCPDDAIRAVTRALEKAGANYEAVREMGHIPESLKPFMVTRAYGPEMIDAAEAATRLKIPEKKVREWVEQGVLIGWESMQHGTTIPKEQILGPKRVVPGIKEILEVIRDSKNSWYFISREWPFRDDVMRPIDKLKQGKVQEVLDSAPGYGEAFS